MFLNTSNNLASKHSEGQPVRDAHAKEILPKWPSGLSQKSLGFEVSTEKSNKQSQAREVLAMHHENSNAGG